MQEKQNICAQAYIIFIYEYETRIPFVAVEKKEKIV
jgi:hypothetical protein